MFPMKHNGKSNGKSSSSSMSTPSHTGGSHSAKVKVMTKVHSATSKRGANKKDTDIL